MASAKLKEAEALMRDADKAVKTSLLKWKPDHEVASMLYDQAGMAFKVAKQPEQAKQAFLKAAESHRAFKSMYHCAQALQNAASCAKEQNRFPEYLSLMKQAAMAFREQGQGSAAAESLAKAAQQLVQGGKYMEGAELYLEVVELYEEDDKGRQAKVPLEKAIAAYCKAGEWNKASEALDRQAKLLSSTGANQAFVFQSLLSRTLVPMLRGDTVAADRVYNEAIASYTGFATSTEGRIASDILQAVEDGDQAGFDKARSEQTVSFLLPDITAALRRMDFPREGAGAASAASSAGEERGSGANVSAERAALFGSPSAKTQPKAPAAAAAAASSVAAAAAIAAAASATGKAGKPAAVPSAPPAESGLPSYDEALNDDPVSKGKAGPADTAAATQESGSESEDDGAPPAYSQAREVEVGGARDDEEGTATAVPVERTEDQAEAAEQTEDDTGAAADDGEAAAENNNAAADDDDIL